MLPEGPGNGKASGLEAPRSLNDRHRNDGNGLRELLLPLVRFLRY